MASESDSEDINPLPVCGDAVPKPTQRASSPDLNNFQDPLLSLTPDKPQRIAPIKVSSHIRNGEGSERQKLANKENHRLGLLPPHVSHPKTGTTSQVLMSNPGVLFQQERSNHDLMLQKNLKIIKHAIPGKGVKREVRTKDEIAVANVNKITKANSSSTKKTPPNPKKSTIARSSLQSKAKASDHTGATSKKHVRIVDPKAPLASPELHSTAALGHQLKQIETQTFNAEEVLIKTLQDSEAARVALSERVAEAANIKRNEKKYSGLVSVGVPVESTLQNAVSQRVQRVKWRTQRPSKASEVPPPDILDMFSPSMIVESANQDVNQLIPSKVKPAPVDPDTTFDLYRHMQCWDLGV